MVFPQLSNFSDELYDTIQNRAGNNINVSKLIPWLRLSTFSNTGTSNGLVLDSTSPGGLASKYGLITDTITDNTSGIIGIDLSGVGVRLPNDRKYRPSPIVEALNVSFGAGGLTRKCSFTIKTFTKKHAEEVMKHFLEPGFTVLVEYGWNTNKSWSQRASLDPCTAVKYLDYEFLKNKHSNSNYEYDGFLGYITGGKLTSGEGETYNIEVDITAVGDAALYLQQHRGDGSTVDDTKQEGSKPFAETEISNYANENDIGKVLFCQMFNRLPERKQTKSVRDLIFNKELTSPDNFVNIDTEVIEKVNSEIGPGAIKSLANSVLQMAGREGFGTSVQITRGDDKKVASTIPNGIDLLSKHSYIRMKLAFEILNAYSINLKPTKNKSLCSETTTLSLIIDYKNTICRGFDNMFSTDGSKLFVPNPNAPDFGLRAALVANQPSELQPILSKDSKYSKPTKTVNLVPPSLNRLGNSVLYDNTVSPRGVGIIRDLNFTTSNPIREFPQQTSLKQSNRYKSITDTITQDLPAKTWGFLEDLFINFEFFCEVLDRANYVTKDVYYELLNGISSAVNSIWHFEIASMPSPYNENKNQYMYQIVDLNLCGITKSEYDNAKVFDSTGIKTPFLSSELSIDIPAAIKNKIIAERNSSEIRHDVLPEGNTVQDFTGIFSNSIDPVLTALNSMKANLKTDDKNAPATPPSAEESRKQAMTLFTQRSTIVTFQNDRTTDISGPIDSFLKVIAYNDVSIFRTLDRTNQDSKKANNILVPITFTFKIHGTSGIKTGDMFRLSDLPNGYTNSVWQVTEVSHDLSGGLWTTNVTAKLRNIN